MRGLVLMMVSLRFAFHAKGLPTLHLAHTRLQ